MRTLLVFIAVSVAAGASALAQTGPVKPRFVYGVDRDVSIPYSFDPEEPVYLELTVGADGTVHGLRRLETSGDAAFDKMATNYAAKIRLVPGIDANGVPVTDILRAYVDRGGAYAARSDRGLESAEKERIDRMRCKDFLWEYEFMRQIAEGHSLSREALVDYSLEMFTERHRVKRSAIYRLKANLDITVLASVVQCQQKPDEAYWSAVFVPTVQAQMRRLGLGHKP